ncbi:MAG TPA: antitoxin VapB family protein [Thermoplasmata archaeon]|nr:antitoxin VapB family protein [Thermoplasmata archaeon]
MPSQNIAVQKGVYDALRKEKRGDESFTGLFRRLLYERGTLDEILGSWGKTAAASDRASLHRLREGGRP